MTDRDTFHVSVAPPERTVWETEAVFVAFPAHDGETQNGHFIDQGFAPDGRRRTHPPHRASPQAQ